MSRPTWAQVTTCEALDDAMTDATTAGHHHLVEVARALIRLVNLDERWVEVASAFLEVFDKTTSKGSEQ